MSDASSTDARLVALEERLAFQQRVVEELNEVVLAQQRRIDVLSREMAAWQGAVERLTQRGDGGDDLPYEKPPHY